jgi:hypothetical protein
MRAAMGQAILSARYLISNFPREGEWLLTTAIAMGFTDMPRNRPIHAACPCPCKPGVEPAADHAPLEQAILDVPSPTTRVGIRDRAMLHLCFSCGLRVSERWASR